MKVKLSQIKIGNFTVRDEIEKEYLKELKESLQEDGQWNPIIVRPSDGGYEVIAGHTRFQAAKELGWKDLEVNVRDLTDEESDFLALKTNLMRSDMSQIEEGKVIKKIIDKYNLTQKEMGKQLGKSDHWVGNRLKLVMKVSDYVRRLFDEKKLTSEQLVNISTIESEKEQDEFAKYLVENNIPAGEPTKKALKRFKNKTIFTMGYEGKTIDTFIDILKKNQIEYVIDIRASAESKHKPEFNRSVLERSLKQAGVKYEHHPELGIPYPIAQSYKDGYLKTECLKQWYDWNLEVKNQWQDKLDGASRFAEHLKDLGKCVFLCMEEYAKPLRNQEHHCHRDILADIILNTDLFSERIDL